MQELDENELAYYNKVLMHNRQIDEDNERLTWSEMFIEIAKVVAKRSKDPKTKVGAVLVKNNHVIGIGYNGEPKHFTYEFDWHSTEKYDYVIHAEMNAVTNACLMGCNVADSDIYVTLSPCHECMKLLIQHQIRTIYYLDEYKDFELTKRLADNSEIKLIKL